MKKSIQYAYATSPWSEKYNNSLGCWLVFDGTDLPPFTYQDSEKQKALQMFKDINRPIDTTISFLESSDVFKY